MRDSDGSASAVNLKLNIRSIRKLHRASFQKVRPRAKSRAFLPRDLQDGRTEKTGYSNARLAEREKVSKNKIHIRVGATNPTKFAIEWRSIGLNPPVVLT